MLRKYQFFFFLFLSLFFLQACQTLGYENVDTTRKGIAVANAELRGANLLLQDLVRRNAISRGDAQSALDGLREVHTSLQTALNLVTVGGDPVTAQSHLQRANATLTIAIQLLSQFTATGDPL